MKKLFLFLSLCTAVLAQQNRVVDPNNMPNIPVGATNVPASYDTYGRLIVNSGDPSGTPAFRVGQTNINPSMDGKGRVLVNDTGGGGKGVTQIVAGTDISVSPADGKGVVTINSTSVGGVSQLVAGTNVTLSPTNGKGVVTINASGGGGGSPGGSNTQLQYNNSGAFGGSVNTYNNSTNATTFNGVVAYNYTTMSGTAISNVLPAEVRTLTADEQESFTGTLASGYTKRVRYISSGGSWKVTFNTTVNAFGFGDVSSTGFVIPSGTAAAYEVVYYGTGGAPYASAPTPVNLTTGVTGTLPSANGGTGVNNGANLISLGGNLTTSIIGGGGPYSLELQISSANRTVLPSMTTWWDTPSSSNLRGAVTDESGTGALLFANGNIGTITGGVLTNATGLPLTTGVTGTLPFGNGGTGQTSYTDGQLLIGNTATGGLSKATLTAGSNVTITNGNGTIQIAASGGGGSSANPSATIGLTAVNGVASTFMTSDSAPPLSQAIAPTWTGTHTFNRVVSHALTNANESAITTSGYSVTGSSTTPLFDLAGTWNTTGGPAAIKLNITDTASTGGALLMQLQTNSTNVFRVEKTGIVRVASDIVGNGNVQSATGGAFQIGSRGMIKASASNQMELYDNSAGNTFGILCFGGTSTSYPALKRSGATLQTRLADDSTFATLSTGQLNANGNVNVATVGSTVVVASGTNAKSGTFTLTAGAATVSNTSVTANSVIIFSIKTVSGSTGATRIGTITAATGFTVTGLGTDNSTYNYIIMEVN